MFDDLSLEELEALRVTVRAAYVKLVSGEKPSDIRYADMSRSFHPTSAEACEAFLAKITDAINRRNGCGAGGFNVVGF